MLRKRRTRSHIIADLSVNHVERHALLCGYTVERTANDYGIDLTLTTYNQEGEVEEGNVLFQLKATDTLRLSPDGTIALFSVARADLELWLRQVFPLMLVVYDAPSDTAYWLYVQAYFEAMPDFQLTQIGQTTTLRIPVSNVVDQTAMRVFARFRDDVNRQIQQVVHFDYTTRSNGNS